jgi:hypothetical protein
MSRERELWIGFHGIFRLRKFFMNKMPRLYAKLFFRSFIRSKAAFREAITGRASKYEQEYLYARYINSWLENDELHRKMLNLLAEWLHKEKLTRLVDTLSDVFVFDGNNIVIVTSRPGLWIGKMGSTIDSLSAFMREKFLPSTKVLLKEINSPALELKRIIEDIDNPWGDFMKCCGSSCVEFMDYLDEYVKDEKKNEPLYKSINTGSNEYATLESYTKIK